MDQVLVAIRSVADLESKLQITEPWTENHPEYKTTFAYLQQRDYHRVLNKLQQLVVQRLFELSKANVMGMGMPLISFNSQVFSNILLLKGYKLRETVWRALKTRGKAIRAALSKYNSIAPLMTPPAPTLEWKQLMDYAFVSEFELLKYSCSYKNIITEPWATPLNREITTKYFKILRAREEIIRVNIELRRLRTSICDEHIMFEHHIQRLHTLEPLLAAEVQRLYNTRRRVNVTHLRILNSIEALKDFSGICGPGVRLGAMEIHDPLEGMELLVNGDAAERAHPSDAECRGSKDVGNRDDDGPGAEADDDDLNEQIIGLTDAIMGVQSVDGVPDNMLFQWRV